MLDTQGHFSGKGGRGNVGGGGGGVLLLDKQLVRPCVSVEARGHCRSVSKGEPCEEASGERALDSCYCTTLSARRHLTLNNRWGCSEYLMGGE